MLEQTPHPYHHHHHHNHLAYSSAASTGESIKSENEMSSYYTSASSYNWNDYSMQYANNYQYSGGQSAQVNTCIPMPNNCPTSYPHAAVSCDETTSSSYNSESVSSADDRSESLAPMDATISTSVATGQTGKETKEGSKLIGLPDTCRKCGLHFADDRKLVRHMKVDHYYIETLHFTESDPGDRQKRYDEWFKKQMNRASLPKELNGQYFKPYKCDLCHQHYSYKGTLSRHRLKRHNLTTFMDGELIKPSAAPSDHYLGSFVCKSCDYTANSRKLFERHVLRKHFDGIQPYPCDQCSESFDRSDRLLWHRRQKHAKVPSYTCNDCGRSYRTKLVYERHQRLQHTGHQFNCKECPKVFKSYASFDYHRRKHMGVEGMKFICEFCGFRFWSNQNRRKHIAKCHPDHKVDSVALEENSRRDWSKEASITMNRSKKSQASQSANSNGRVDKSPAQQLDETRANDFSVCHLNNDREMSSVEESKGNHFLPSAHQETGCSDHDLLVHCINSCHNNTCDGVSPGGGESGTVSAHTAVQMTQRYVSGHNTISPSPPTQSSSSSSSSSPSSSSSSSPVHYSALDALSPSASSAFILQTDNDEVGDAAFITHAKTDIAHDSLSMLNHQQVIETTSETQKHLMHPHHHHHYHEQCHQGSQSHLTCQDHRSSETSGARDANCTPLQVQRCKMCFAFVYDLQDHLMHQHKVAFEALGFFLDLR